MGLTYRDAGVDIDVGNEVVRRIGPLAAATWRPGVLNQLGGFSGLFGLKEAGYTDPVLVSGADGVGTKLKVAFLTGVHDTVGIDLVAMCVNDVLCVGAEPLFFLDYFSTGRLLPDVAEAVVAGIADGCRMAGCALLGGETAEMPGIYGPGEYDLAGFAVGAVERTNLLQRGNVRQGDALVGLRSSGLHSNGFSLARRALLDGDAGFDVSTRPPGWSDTLGEAMLRPTRIYATPVQAVMRRHWSALHSIAHITGGGLVENVPRVLPEGFSADFHWDGGWPEPPIFGLIRDQGVAEDEMRRTFNLGIGMVLVVAPAEADEVMETLRDAGEDPLLIGRVVADE